MNVKSIVREYHHTKYWALSSIISCPHYDVSSCHITIAIKCDPLISIYPLHCLPYLLSPSEVYYYGYWIWSNVAPYCPHILSSHIALLFYIFHQIQILLYHVSAMRSNLR